MQQFKLLSTLLSETVSHYIILSLIGLYGIVIIKVVIKPIEFKRLAPTYTKVM